MDAIANSMAIICLDSLSEGYILHGDAKVIGSRDNFDNVLGDGPSDLDGSCFEDDNCWASNYERGKYLLIQGLGLWR